MQSLHQRRHAMQLVIEPWEQIASAIKDIPDWLDMLSDDPSLEAEVEAQWQLTEKILSELEWQRMFCRPEDPNHCFIDIQAGSGGTEAQDWAEMLLRMYLRWAERHDMSPRLVEASAGEVAGIKSATIHLTGQYAYGWMRSETGVHRLVRKSPFDSGNRRHTSFASVFVAPEIDDQIEVDLKLSDCRVDTYRASGAGGQHVNKTDSAVRITHLPSGAVAQCQSERSQHQNKDRAIKLLKAKLYQLALEEQKKEQQVVESSKKEISWGSQIRSYVLDASRIKDLRTGVEVGNTQAVLDGDLDVFIKAFLRAQID
jgi:peptide chain release factor 2